MTCGIKICYARLRDPMSREFLLIIEENSACKSMMQSQDHSFAFEICLMKDRKEGYNQFRNFF